MLYEFDNPIIDIVSVAKIKWDAEYDEVEGRDYSALAFRIKGNADIKYNGMCCSANTNDVLYLPQNISYTAEYSDTEILAIHFVTAKNDKYAEVYSFENSERIYKLFLKAWHLWQGKKDGYKTFVMSVLYEILGTVYEENNKTRMPEHFVKAVSIINGEYNNSALSIKDVCKRAGIGETVFRRLFSENFKKPPLAYITELRLEDARILIAGGSSVEQAAYECGFNDSKYFARVVKKYLGCTPRELKTYGK